MHKILELLLAIVIVGTTLAFGGVQPLTYSLAQAALFLAVLLLLWRQTRQGEINLPLPVWPGLFLLWVLLQLVPLPSSLLGSISPLRLLGPSHGDLSHGQGVWTTLSIYPHDSVVALLKFLACLSAFVLGAYLFDSRKRKSLLLRVLILLGCSEAVYGIVQYLTGWQKIFAYTKQFDLQEATGTYINRNHFAGLLELTLPFVVASLYYSFQLWSEERHSGTSRNGSSGGNALGFQTIFYVFLLLIMMVGVLFSRSRMGILAALITLLFMFLAVLARLRTGRRTWMIGVLVFLFCVLAYGIWIGLGPVLARFEPMQESSYLQMEGRISIWKDSLGVIRDYPLTGTGLGTFGVAFRHYQTDLVNFYVDHAHNDYLEFATDTGLLGAALLFLPIFYLFFKMVVSFLNDPRRYRPAVTLGCIGSTLAMLVHSVTDFNLQIPANALIFAVVLGIGYKAVCVERREEKHALRASAGK
ncbi:MAG: O-antigen ligase family protein [Terriglobia bacterium]